MRLNGKTLSSEATFRDGELEYSSFEGGYFDPEGGTMYYLTDWQGGDTAVIDRSYDHAGRVCSVKLSDRISRTMSYNVNGWLTASTASIEKSGLEPAKPLLPLSAAASQASITLPGQSYTSVIFSENLYYADRNVGFTPRYDGKISGRSSGNRATAYNYDNHGRLASSVTVKPQISLPALRDDADFSTAYTYDRNANIKTMTRQGVTDIVDGKAVYGLHDEVTMSYSRNRLSSVSVETGGADYEGRTGLKATDGTVTGFAYDANGNMTADPVRGINRIVYNHLNLPTEITFASGHRQTITYDGLGRKIRVDYAEGPETVLGQGFPVEQAYQVQSSRYYAGPHIFCDGELEYSSFDGGYFDPDGGTMYYITDWQGNNAAVVSNKGDIVQQTTYYPYGEPTVEPVGQRFLFGGKEREHAAGRNTYDFSARCLTPYGRWGVNDRKAEKNCNISPYAYCSGDPINFIDPDGELEWPVQYPYKGLTPVHSNDFGVVDKLHPKPHTGVDINIGRGDFDRDAPVLATHDGKIVRIVKVEDGNGGGIRITIASHDGRITTSYMHMEKTMDALKVGQYVKEGQQIGFIGNTGRSSNYHLHYEMTLDGERIDPADGTGLKDPQEMLNPRRVTLDELVVTTTISPPQNLIQVKPPHLPIKEVKRIIIPNHQNVDEIEQIR